MTGYLGYTGEGTNEVNRGNQIAGNPHTLAVEAWVTDMYVFMKRGGSSPTAPKAKCCIYSDTTGALMGETVELSISNTVFEWIKFHFTTSVHLQPGTYILATWNDYVGSGSTKYCTYRWILHGPDYIGALEYGEWPDPWTPDNAYEDDVTWSCFMEYSESGYHESEEGTGHYGDIDLVKDRLLIASTDTSYDEACTLALEEASRYVDMELSQYAETLPVTGITIILDIVGDIAAGLFKKRQMPQDMDQGWWSQGLKKLERYIKVTYFKGSALVSGPDSA